MSPKLIGAFPGKRFDYRFHLSDDGRGGWSLSQMNVDRTISDYDGYFLIFCFAALLPNADESWRVTGVRVTSWMKGEQIGCCEIDVEHEAQCWKVLDGDAIFEWPQRIDLQPIQNGLVELRVELLLTDHAQWIQLDGCGYVRIENVGVSADFEQRFQSPWYFSILGILPRKIRRMLTGSA